MNMRLPFVGSLPALIAGLLALITTFPVMSDQAQAERIERGRYLTIITGCNDCHTAGYAMLEGNVPESEWLKGDALGWNGPWGTTYAPNLRLSLSTKTEDQWVVFAQNLRSRPPMPSVNLNQFTEQDLRAVYAYIRQLQPLGDSAPAYLPPGQEPPNPFVSFPAPPRE